MSHLSPCVFLVWTILTTALGGFYFHHLWKFDRFRCLNLARGHNGTFKRVMTYSYLIAVPTLLTYTVGLAIIKYQEGFVTSPSGSVLPKPFEFWTQQHQAAIFPLNIFWALSWGSEAVTHLEELCFWLFLIHAGPSPTSWFKSIYFRIWAGGSLSAVILVVIVTAATKDDPLKNEAWIQFTGSVISLLITIGFLPILWVFRNFVQTVKNEGADMEAVVRLAKFHELNITRTVFRFLFVIPVFLLSIDGLRPHTHTLNESMMWTDLLVIASGIGCVVQSVITLMIFFPRNVESETQRWLRDPPARTRRIAIVPKIFKQGSKASSVQSQQEKEHPKFLLTDSPIPSQVELPAAGFDDQPYLQPPLNYHDPPLHRSQPWDDQYSMTSLDKRDSHSDIHRTVTGNSLGLTLTEANLRAHSEIISQVNPLALYFTSPIDLLDVPRRRTGR